MDRIEKKLGRAPALLNPNFHCYVYKSLPLVPNLRQLNSFHTLPLYFFKIDYNIIFSSTPRSFLQVFPPEFSIYFTSFHLYYMVPFISSQRLIVPLCFSSQYLRTFSHNKLTLSAQIRS
jgi:hypothetical protein